MEKFSLIRIRVDAYKKREKTNIIGFLSFLINQDKLHDTTSTKIS